jgi:2-dehydro-3-deoxygalactonokinase
MGPIIAVDWGTSRLRAALVQGDGTIERRAESGAGILGVPGGDFAGALAALIGGWPRLPVLAAGMIGSRQGWREVPYVPCPAGLAEIAAGMAEAAPGIFIVPGLAWSGPDGVPDVMRGEETQALGSGIAEGLIVLPGTHSKWVRLAEGRIASFATFMTGEVFAVFSQHSILGRLMTGETTDESGFERGLARGRREGAALLHDLFSVRTLGLFDAIPPEALRSYLSGMLIGSEIAAATRAFGTPDVIVGAPSLAARYQRALAQCGATVPIVAAETATVRGLLALAAHR